MKQPHYKKLNLLMKLFIISSVFVITVVSCVSKDTKTASGTLSELQKKRYNDTITKLKQGLEVLEATLARQALDDNFAKDSSSENKRLDRTLLRRLPYVFIKDSLVHECDILVEELETIKKLLETKAGKGKINKQSLKTPYEIKTVERLMLKERRGYMLEEKLNNYVKYIHKEYKNFDIPEFTNIAINNQKFLFFKNRPKKFQQDFAHAYFSNTPVVVAITYITYFQSIAIRYRDEVINYMVLRLLDPK